MKLFPVLSALPPSHLHSFPHCICVLPNTAKMPVPWDEKLITRATVESHFEASQEFVSSDYTTRASMAMVKSGLSARNEICNPDRLEHLNSQDPFAPQFCDIPHDEIKQRLDLAMKAKALAYEHRAVATNKEEASFTFNSMHLALFIYAEIDTLRYLVNYEPAFVLDRLRFVEPTLKLCELPFYVSLIDGLAIIVMIRLPKFISPKLLDN